MTTVTYEGEGRCYGCDHYGLAALYTLDDDERRVPYCYGCAVHRGARF